MIHAEVTVRPDPFGKKVSDVGELAQRLLDIVTRSITAADQEKPRTVSVNVRYADMRFDRTTSSVQVLLFVTEHPWTSPSHQRFLRNRFLDEAVKQMPELGKGELSLVVSSAGFSVSK